MHSILALAASHMGAVSSTNAAESAIRHRILAVQSLNEALSVPPKSRNEQDARLAAALALTCQSSHIEDGLAEFLTMIRGCNLIAANDTSFCSSDAVMSVDSPASITTVGISLPTSCFNRQC